MVYDGAGGSSADPTAPNHLPYTLTGPIIKPNSTKVGPLSDNNETITNEGLKKGLSRQLMKQLLTKVH